MGTFLSEHSEVVIAFVVILLSIIGFFMKAFFERISKLEKEDVRLKAAQDLMKSNYLERFEDVKSHQTEEGRETRDMLGDIKIMIASISEKVDSQAKFCAFVQESKK